MMMQNSRSNSINSIASSSIAMSPSPSLCSANTSIVQQQQSMSAGGVGGRPSSAHTSPMRLYMMNGGAAGGFDDGETVTESTAGDDGGSIQQNGQQLTEGERQQPEQCLVCNDMASGFHYGTPSCNGCKTFFRRTVMKNQTFQCQYEGNCPVDKTIRCTCRHCRFKKCLAVGMNKDAIQHNRDPIGYTKRTRRCPADKQKSQQQQQKQQQLKQHRSMVNAYNFTPNSNGTRVGNSFSSSLSGMPMPPAMVTPSLSFNGTRSAAHPLVPPFSASSCSFGDALTAYSSTAGGAASSFAGVSAPPPPFSPFTANFLPLMFNSFGPTASAGGFYNHMQQQYLQHQQYQRQMAAVDGTISQFGTCRKGGTSTGNSAGFMWSGDDILSNRNFQNGIGGGVQPLKQQQQQQKYQQNEFFTERMEEDNLLRRLIAIEQILIRLRNSKMSVQKSLKDLVINKSSVFDDAAMVSKMASEAFPKPCVLHKAKAEDYLYWHEREWQLMIEWAKMLPVFLSLSVADKLALVRHSVITFPSLLQCFYSPDVGPDTIVFPDGAFFDRSSDLANSSGFQRKNFKMLDNLLSPLRKMKIDQNEFAGAKAIFFLNPGNFEDDSDADDLSPDAKQRIAVTRSAITNSLYRYMVLKRGSEQAAEKFGKLLLLGTAIATMSCEMKEAVVVADFFDQSNFSSFARQLLLARNENDLMLHFVNSDDNEKGVQPQRKNVKKSIVKIVQVIVPKKKQTKAKVMAPSNEHNSPPKQQGHHHDATHCNRSTKTTPKTTQGTTVAMPMNAMTPSNDYSAAQQQHDYHPPVPGNGTTKATASGTIEMNVITSSNQYNGSQQQQQHDHHHAAHGNSTTRKTTPGTSSVAMSINAMTSSHEYNAQQQLHDHHPAAPGNGSTKTTTPGTTAAMPMNAMTPSNDNPLQQHSRAATPGAGVSNGTIRSMTKMPVNNYDMNVYANLYIRPQQHGDNDTASDAGLSFDTTRMTTPNTPAAMPINAMTSPNLMINYTNNYNGPQQQHDHHSAIPGIGTMATTLTSNNDMNKYNYDNNYCLDDGRYSKEQQLNVLMGMLADDSVGVGRTAVSRVPPIVATQPAAAATLAGIMYDPNSSLFINTALPRVEQQMPFSTAAVSTAGVAAQKTATTTTATRMSSAAMLNPLRTLLAPASLQQTEMHETPPHGTHHQHNYHSSAHFVSPSATSFDQYELFRHYQKQQQKMAAITSASATVVRPSSNGTTNQNCFIAPPSLTPL